jgi:hypothetical protein
MWNSRLHDQKNTKLFPINGEESTYQIVAKPVTFGDEIHGVVLWGSLLDRKTLESIKEISSVDIALYSKEGVNTFTLPSRKEEELSNLIKQ